MSDPRIELPADRFQDGANRALALLIIGAAAVSFVVIFILAELGMESRLADFVGGLIGMAVVAAFAAALVLPLAVFGAARFSRPPSAISRALRRAVVVQGLVLALLLLVLGGIGDSSRTGIATFAAAAACLGFAVAAIAHHRAADAPAPRFGATALASIALVLFLVTVPGFGSTAEKAFISGMSYDLAVLRAAQDEHREATGAFTAEPTVGGRFQPSRRVTIEGPSLTPDGWHATATHEASDARCEISVSPGPAEEDLAAGRPRCDAPGAPSGAQTAAAYGGAVLALAWLALFRLARRFLKRASPVEA